MRHTLMDDILAAGGISILFQPIFSVVGGQRSIFALEALSRGPRKSNVERADVLFEYVRRMGRESAVDRVCVGAALGAASAIEGAHNVSINVHAATIEKDDNFAGFIFDMCDRTGIATSRVILEIVEQQQYWDDVNFFKTLDTVRNRGIRIALDDIGLGYSNYRTLIEVRPDFYKIDRYFVSGSRVKENARAAIESIVLLANRLGGRAIAEGIETEDDLETVAELGIDLVQGFHLARPKPACDLTN
jgi:EAL domain-containing protein (putative c-di-GMP-specific phosphodiesterase class I)